MIRPPEIIASQRQWLCWRLEGDGPKPAKVPYYSDGTRRRGVQGSQSDRSKLVTFDEALSAVGFAGVGYASMSGAGITVVDFDNVVIDGELRPDVERLCLGTYTETSPSGRGIHAFFIGEVPGNRKDLAPPEGGFCVEFFATKGFTTYTGQPIETFADGIAPLSEDILTLYTERFGAGGAQSERKPSDIDPRDAARMLTFISPDCDYDQWWRIAQGLHHEFGAEGFPLFDSWSKDGATYPGRDALVKKWKSITGNPSGQVVTIGTIKGLASSGGWSDFDAVDFPSNVAPVEDESRPAFVECRKSDGRVPENLHNTMLALEHPTYTGCQVSFDELSGSVMIEHGTGIIRPFADDDYTWLRRRLYQREFLKAPTVEIIRAAVHAVAKQRSFDSAQNWLSGLQWDKVPRIANFMQTYLGCPDTDYMRGVALYMWSALAGRVITPGVKADMVPVLIGEQGAGKSRAVRALVPEDHLFCELDLQDKDADISRKVRGKLVVELGELRGLNSKDANHIKSFISKTHEAWVPKYIEYETIIPRRLLFVGTSNDSEFLTDTTGNRRWLPVEVGRIDVDTLIIDRDQLWAEAATYYREHGIHWAVEKLSAEVHSSHMIRDIWEDTIAAWLENDCVIGGRPADREFRIIDVVKGALEIPEKMVTRREEMRVASCLRALGYDRYRKRDGSNRTYFYNKCPF